MKLQVRRLPRPSVSPKGSLRRARASVAGLKAMVSRPLQPKAPPLGAAKLQLLLRW